MTKEEYQIIKLALERYEEVLVSGGGWAPDKFKCPTCQAEAGISYGRFPYNNEYTRDKMIHQKNCLWLKAMNKVQKALARG